MNVESHIPHSVIAFLRDHVDHEMKLRMLVLLHAAPDTSRRVGLLGNLLDLPLSNVREIADELAAKSLVRVTGDLVQLAPTSIDQRLAIADVARTYAANRPALLSLLEAMRRQSDRQ